MAKTENWKLQLKTQPKLKLEAHSNACSGKACWHVFNEMKTNSLFSFDLCFLDVQNAKRQLLPFWQLPFCWCNLCQGHFEMVWKKFHCPRIRCQVTSFHELLNWSLNWSHVKNTYFASSSATIDYKPSPSPTCHNWDGNTCLDLIPCIFYMNNILCFKRIFWGGTGRIFDFCNNLQLKQFFFYWLDFCSTNDQSIENNKSNYCPFWPKYLLLFFFSKKSRELIYYRANKFSRKGCTRLALEILL